MGARCPALLDGCSSFTVPCQEGYGIWETSLTQVSLETPVWLHCPSCYSVQFNFSSHPPTHPRATRNQDDLLTVHSHTGAARCRPSDGCSSFAVPCQEGNRIWETSQTPVHGVCSSNELPPPPPPPTASPHGDMPCPYEAVGLPIHAVHMNWAQCPCTPMAWRPELSLVSAKNYDSTNLHGHEFI